MGLLEDRALTLFRNRALTPDLTKTFDLKIKSSLIKKQKDEKYCVKSYHSCLEIKCEDSASLFEPFTCETKVAEYACLFDSEALILLLALPRGTYRHTDPLRRDFLYRGTH